MKKTIKKLGEILVDMCAYILGVIWIVVCVLSLCIELIFISWIVIPFMAIHNRIMFGGTLSENFIELTGIVLDAVKDYFTELRTGNES